MPAGSYPRYSRLLSPSKIMGRAGLCPAYPIIPHIYHAPWFIPWMTLRTFLVTIQVHFSRIRVTNLKNLRDLRNYKRLASRSSISQISEILKSLKVTGWHSNLTIYSSLLLLLNFDLNSYPKTNIKHHCLVDRPNTCDNLKRVNGGKSPVKTIIV